MQPFEALIKSVGKRSARFENFLKESRNRSSLRQRPVDSDKTGEEISRGERLERVEDSNFISL